MLSLLNELKLATRGRNKVKKATTHAPHLDFYYRDFLGMRAVVVQLKLSKSNQLILPSKVQFSYFSTVSKI